MDELFDGIHISNMSSTRWLTVPPSIHTDSSHTHNNFKDCYLSQHFDNYLLNNSFDNITIVNNTDYVDWDDSSATDAFYWLRQVTLVAILCTFVFGLAGNCFVMYIVGYNGSVRVQSVANYYIWNLALADSLYVLALPLTGWATYFNRSL